MLLEKLLDYSQRLALPSEMYIETRIQWLIDLDANGKLVGFRQTAGEQKGKKNRGKSYIAPYALVSSGIVPKLLVGNGEYVLGLTRDINKHLRVQTCHKKFMELIQECVQATDEPAVKAVDTFLINMVLDYIDVPEGLEAGDICSFCIDGVIPFEIPSVKQFWANRQAIAGEVMQCLICGDLKSPAKRQPFKIKGIRGGQPSGMALVSVNNSAGESYSLEAALNSPICQDCAERYAKAANSLIRDIKTHLQVGTVTYLFWTKNDMDFNPVSLLSNPQPEDVKQLLESMKTGAGHPKIESGDFYATALSASGGRVVVRDWLETTVENVQKNIARYFSIQQVTGGDEEFHPLGLRSLVKSLLPKKEAGGRAQDDAIPPGIPKALLQLAIKGSPLPTWLLIRAVNRNRAEQGISRPRAALIKMVLLSQKSAIEENEMQQLNLDNHEPAYLCGRLLAVLESVQKAAIPGINTTIVDRFYGMASTAPAVVFGQLIKMAQVHLAKLRRDRPGTQRALQQKLEEIQINLNDFPKTLTLEQQGLFSLGYYHQRAYDSAAARAYRGSK